LRRNTDFFCVPGKFPVKIPILTISFMDGLPLQKIMSPRILSKDFILVGFGTLRSPPPPADTVPVIQPIGRHYGAPPRLLLPSSSTVSLFYSPCTEGKCLTLTYRTVSAKPRMDLTYVHCRGFFSSVGKGSDCRPSTFAWLETERGTFVR